MSTWGTFTSSSWLFTVSQLLYISRSERVLCKLMSPYGRVGMLSLMTSIHCTHKMMAVTKRRCKYLFFNEPLFQPSWKKEKMLVLVTETMRAFLEGSMPHVFMIFSWGGRGGRDILIWGLQDNLGLKCPECTFQAILVVHKKPGRWDGWISHWYSVFK